MKASAAFKRKCKPRSVWEVNCDKAAEAAVGDEEDF